MRTCKASSLCICGCLLMFCCPSSVTNAATRYRRTVQEFADNVIEHGKDVYGAKHTPLFIDGINIHTQEPPKWKRDGKTWILSNLASQQNLFRVLDGLTALTGDEKYRRAAVDAVEYAFEHLRSPNGLLHWGGHVCYDALNDNLCMEQYSHELKSHYPYYELMWRVDPDVTKKYLETFWAAHVLNWGNLEMNRHGNMKKKFDVPWDNEYKAEPVFFWGTGLSFLNTGSDLFYAGAMLAELSGEDKPLVWAERLAYRYVETRDPNVGISGYQFNQSRTATCAPGIRGDRAQYQYGDDFKGHFVVEGTLFPCYGSTPAVRPRICQFLIGEMLGDKGHKFTQWAVEELTAWGKVAYRKKDNSFIPMLTDGTSMEGYVCKKDGYFGPEGRVLKAGRAGPMDFWVYCLAYRVTGDAFMWEMTRNIVEGNNWGRLGDSPDAEPKLDLATSEASAQLIPGLLELYRKTNCKQYLMMARKVGDNIIDRRFHKGFFTGSSQHLYAKFDAFEPVALLYLDAMISGKAESVPRVWPTRSFFHCPHDGVGRTYDNSVIYGKTKS